MHFQIARLWTGHIIEQMVDTHLQRIAIDIYTVWTLSDED